MCVQERVGHPCLVAKPLLLLGWVYCLELQVYLCQLLEKLQLDFELSFSTFTQEWQDAGKWTLQCLVFSIHKTYYLLCERVPDACNKEREISVVHRSVLIEWNNLHNLGLYTCTSLGIARLLGTEDRKMLEF